MAAESAGVRLVDDGAEDMEEEIPEIDHEVDVDTGMEPQDVN